MKKLSLVLASALLLGGISFASPVVKQNQTPATTTAPAKTTNKKMEKKSTKKTGKMEKKSTKKTGKMEKKSSKPSTTTPAKTN